MIDIHCHYLFGVDDGAKTIDESLELARASVADGITHAVMTPHVYPGRWNNTLSSLLPIFVQLQNAIESEKIPLTIALGGEVHLLPDSLALIDENELPFIGEHGGRRLVLLELPDSHIPPGTMQAIEYLAKRQIVPVIAHPERNKDVMRSFQRLVPLVEAGCLLQLTAGSIGGDFGAQAQAVAIRILDNDWAFAVASDAHNMRYRPPVMSAARDAIQQRYGRDRAEALTFVNASKILTQWSGEFSS